MACPFDDPLFFFRAWVLFILFVSLLLLACAVGLVARDCVLRSLILCVVRFPFLIRYPIFNLSFFLLLLGGQFLT